MTHLSRAAVLADYEVLVRERGADPAALLRRFELDPAALAHEDNWIATRNIARLLGAAARETGSRHFALELVRHQQINTLGLIGLFLQTSTTLAEAIEDYIAHDSIHAQGLDWRLDTWAEQAHLSVRFDLSGLDSDERRQLTDHTLAQAVKVIRSLTGGHVVPLRVAVHYDDPDAERCRRLYGVPVAFNADTDGVVLRRSDLQVAMIKQDQDLHAALAQFIAGMSQAPGEDLLPQVRAIIRRLLPTGRCSLEQVAACFACDKRTLQRHLQHHGSNYQQLLDEVRCDTATGYLRGSRLSVTQLASLLGYTDAANFSRAFRRHFGVPPSHYRRLS